MSRKNFRVALKFDSDLKFVTFKVTRGKFAKFVEFAKTLRLTLNRMMRMSKDMIEDQITHTYGIFVISKCGKFGQNWRFCVKKCKSLAEIPNYNKPHVINMQEQCKVDRYNV